MQVFFNGYFKDQLNSLISKGVSNMLVKYVVPTYFNFTPSFNGCF